MDIKKEISKEVGDVGKEFNEVKNDFQKAKSKFENSVDMDFNEKKGNTKS